MRSVARFRKKQKEEDWGTDVTRTSGLMRHIWKTLDLPFLTEIAADKTWKSTVVGDVLRRLDAG